MTQSISINLSIPQTIEGLKEVRTLLKSIPETVRLNWLPTGGATVVGTNVLSIQVSAPQTIRELKDLALQVESLPGEMAVTFVNSKSNNHLYPKGIESLHGSQAPSLTKAAGFAPFNAVEQQVPPTTPQATPPVEEAEVTPEPEARWSFADSPEPLPAYLVEMLKDLGLKPGEILVYKYRDNSPEFPF